jgi:2-phospho-L-lactate transferase/gluconeogenesis factor (CofD/UPF0052 family)
MSQAVKVYVCNVATQHGETDSFTVSDHYQTLHDHVNSHLFQYVIANDNISKRLPQEWHSEPVRIDQERLNGAVVLSGDVISEENRYYHDPGKLASLLIRVYYGRPQVAQGQKARLPAPESEEQRVEAAVR